MNFKDFLNEIKINKDKFIKAAIINKRNAAAVDQLKGDSKAEKRHSKQLDRLLKLTGQPAYESALESDLNTILEGVLTEGLDDAMKDLSSHVSKENPSLSDITTMHDKVRNISKSYDVSANELYDKISNGKIGNVHDKFKEASKLD